VPPPQHRERRGGHDGRGDRSDEHGEHDPLPEGVLRLRDDGGGLGVEAAATGAVLPRVVQVRLVVVTGGHVLTVDVMGGILRGVVEDIVVH
jgi:hypothetical protein